MTPADLSEIKEQLKSIDNSGQGWKWDWVDGCVHDEDTDEVICVVEADDDGAIGDFIANSITRIPDLLAHISELSTENKKLIETGERLTIENKQLIEKMEQLESALQLRWVPISNPPDNGQIVLCGNRNWQLSVPIVAQYSDDELEEESFFADIDGDHVQPTHWMRIANLPSTKEDAE
jgi:hypothetical protein